MKTKTLSFTYSKEQVRNLLRNNIFPTSNAKYYLAFFTIVIFGMTALVFSVPSNSLHGLAMIIYIGRIILSICTAVWLFVLVNILISYFFTPKIVHERSPAYQDTFTVTLSDEGMAFIQEIRDKEEIKVTKGFLKWTEFKKKAESPEFIIIYKGNRGNALPKSSFQSELDLNEFRLFLTEQNYIKPKTFNRSNLWRKI